MTCDRLIDFHSEIPNVGSVAFVQFSLLLVCGASGNLAGIVGFGA